MRRHGLAMRRVDGIDHRGQQQQSIERMLCLNFRNDVNYGSVSKFGGLESNCVWMHLGMSSYFAIHTL